LGISAEGNISEIAGMSSEKNADVLAFAWLGCEIHALITSFQLCYWEKDHELQFACC